LMGAATPPFLPRRGVRLSLQFSISLSPATKCGTCSLYLPRNQLPDFPPDLVKLLRVALICIRIRHQAVDEACGRGRATIFRQQEQILVIFEALANEFETDTLDRDVGFPADSPRSSRIDQGPITVAAEQVNICPGVCLTAIGFIDVVVELALDVVFPREPRHDSIGDAAV